MSIHLLEELSSPALDALAARAHRGHPHREPARDARPSPARRASTPTRARYFAEAIAERLVAERPGWHVVLAPTLHLGSFTFETVGTVTMRQRVVRDLLVDYGGALARAGFRYILISNGHGGPGHLVALEEASAIVSRRHGSHDGLGHGLPRLGVPVGALLPKIEAALGRPVTDEEREAFCRGRARRLVGDVDDARCCGPTWSATASAICPPRATRCAHRLVPNYPLRNGGQGYVGHPRWPTRRSPRRR